jgi:DNA primase
MGLRGSDPFVEQVRLATDIVGTISSYIELKRAGKRWKGLCPFHTEKSPSFFVHEENQTFYCFGCHQGGDVFQFVMLQEKLTFPEALRMLAEKAGIPIPRTSARGQSEDRIGEALDVASEFFRSSLGAPEGRAARDYLAARGIEGAQIARFGIGWAPASWDALLRHARRLLPERALLQAGLVVEGERGLYDRFRERVIIPIRTAGGRTVGFGGRLLGPGEPKYLNSPETPLYKKGTVLFGLPEAREGIRQAGNVLVVEGYFDVIALHAGGIDWAVGTCGTALTPEQAGLLRRYSERWTLLFDGDAAGRAAVLRALDAVLGVHPGVRIAICPQGVDPDSWIRRDGPAVVREGCEHALTPLQYLEGWAREEGLTIEETLPRVAEMLRKVTDPLIRDRWVQEAAGRFHLAERRVWEAVGAPAPAARIPGVEREPFRLAARERQIVAAAVQHPGLAADLREACEGVPGIGDICLEILAWIDARSQAGVLDPAELLSLATEEPNLMRDFAFLHEEGGSAESEEGGLLPEDLIRRLRTLGLQHRMRDLTDRIRHVEEQGADVSPLLGEKQRLAAELRALQPGGATSDGNF